MPSGGGPRGHDVEEPPSPDPGSDDPDTSAHDDAGTHRHRIDRPQLINRTDDRWEWRRKIRADPRKLHFYRIGVAVAGALLIILGGITGPLPGPGGIPLVLLGLAVWASEFAWAHRLMGWFKHLLHLFRGWSRRRQVLAWIVFFLVVGVLAYGYLVFIQIPVWLPQFAVAWIRRLPGV